MKGIKGFQRGEHNPSFGKRPHNFGKHPSEETRKKMRESHKGYVMPESQKKKISTSNKGKKKPPRSEEYRRKLGLYNKGRKHSKEWKEKMSKKMRGRKLSKEWKKKIGESHKGKQQSEEHRRKNSEAHKREKSSLWRGGKSFELYGFDWTKLLRHSIRTRDCFICQICKKNGWIVHHIDYNKKNNNPGNLITLCQKCHSKTNFNRNYWIKYFKKMYE